MTITQAILDELTAAAQASPRLRMNLDLRNSPEDLSQRMLNALEPGTVMPIHRHRASSETVVILRGKIRWIFYDERGNATERVTLDADGWPRMLNVEKVAGMPGERLRAVRIEGRPVRSAGGGGYPEIERVLGGPCYG